MLNRLLHAVSSLGPVGYLPKMPGTWGSLAAVILVPFFFLPLTLWTRAGVLVAIFICGGLAAARSEKLLGLTDPGVVVVDELLGQLIVFAPFLSLNPWELAAGFLLFRLFDIAKPWPVRSSETWLPGGFGVMLDDVLAGIYACLVLGLVRMLVLF
ncbi:MAG: phosphatidylglycerophosphatase A [Desulfohalobiaceae bacterium]|nr:phosphatidylglycerophosphatase A [Desulfohalobiaceae bacterium]